MTMFLTKLNEVLSSKKSFISDPMNISSLGLGLLVNIIHWLTLYIKIKPGNGNILLHYNIVYGPDLVDKSAYIYYIPLFALIIFLVNFILSLVFYRKEKLASYFLNFAIIPIQLIFFAASIALIVANE